MQGDVGMDTYTDRMAYTYKDNLIMLLDCSTGIFQYPTDAEDIFEAKFDNRPLWQIFLEDEVADKKTADAVKDKILSIAAEDEPQVYFAEYLLQSREYGKRWYRIGIISPIPQGMVSITITDIHEEVVTKCYLQQRVEYDELTGLLNRSTFTRSVQQVLFEDAEGAVSGEYAIVYFDIIRFKAINDLFGMMEGDRLLKYIADVIRAVIKADDFACRLAADRFVLFTCNSGKKLERLVEKILDALAKYDLPFEIVCNIGVYVTNGEQISVEAMMDRAALAQATIKGSYSTRYNFYKETMRDDMLTEQEIVGMMTEALAENQFVIYLQPQYNHSTGMLIGAEALVRWKHPEKGLISPGVFIPIFEQNGFITKLDLYVFEQVCRFLRTSMDKGLHMVPISTNFSRHDIFHVDFISCLEQIRERYGIPAKYLRVEITESAVMGNSRQTNEIIQNLHQCGYIVEMDDFGSGYSSLNVLKDIDLDIIKLDMRFLEEGNESNRGGTIVSSIIRMAKWLDMPVIAEGVETVEQADFLRSIGCNYIQGYLYSRPIPQEEYAKIVGATSIGAKVPQIDLAETINKNEFWNPKSQETLIFNNYVGGAAIFDYQDGRVEVLRVNKKYLQELGMNLSEKDFIMDDPMRFFDPYNKHIYYNMLDRAIATGEEQECETWRDIVSDCCGTERMCIRSNVQLIGKTENSYLFYATVRNITAEQEWKEEIMTGEHRFKMVSEQIKIYYWEYTIATHEMRPCFRCMRDLGFPPVLTNYPESAIEAGVFPPEVADMYRDWHVQMEQGVKEFSAIMPLMPERIPFHVRYTTEFDENGYPVKAYGSAELVTI